MNTSEDLQRWAEVDDLISRMNVDLYGFDISKLSVYEQKHVQKTSKLRWELEAEADRRNPKPSPELSKIEQLETKKIELQLAKQSKKLERQSKRGFFK